MTNIQGQKERSAGKVILVTVILSVAAGLFAGYGIGYAFQYQGPTTREYFLFNSSVDLNESLYPYIHDTFFPDHLTANRGDTIIIHYINTESPPQGDYEGIPHSPRINQPLVLNAVRGPGMN